MTTFKEVLEALNQIEGLSELTAILDMPDASFDILFPSLQKALKEQTGTAETVQLLEEAKHSGEYQQIAAVIPTIIEELKTVTDASPNKIKFVISILELFDTDVFDANVSIELLDGATCPTYAHLTDAGADVYAAQDILIGHNSYGNLVPVGIKVAIPEGWLLSVRPRSGLSKKTTLRIANAPGTIDTDYRSEVGIIIDNIGDENITIKKGDRIAQLILEKCYRAKWSIVSSVADIGNDRGGGFGSTGK